MRTERSQAAETVCVLVNEVRRVYISTFYQGDHDREKLPNVTVIPKTSVNFQPCLPSCSAAPSSQAPGQYVRPPTPTPQQ